MANGEEKQEQRQTLPKRVALKEDGYYANCAVLEMTPFNVIVMRIGHFASPRPLSYPSAERGSSEMSHVSDLRVTTGRGVPEQSSSLPLRKGVFSLDKAFLEAVCSGYVKGNNEG